MLTNKPYFPNFIQIASKCKEGHRYNKKTLLYLGSCVNPDHGPEDHYLNYFKFESTGTSLDGTIYQMLLTVYGEKYGDGWNSIGINYQFKIFDFSYSHIDRQFRDNKEYFLLWNTIVNKAKNKANKLLPLI